MHVDKECRDCLIRLVDLTVALATPEAGRREAARVAALAVIEAEFVPGAVPALIANRFHLAIQEITANPDPFLARKQSETAFLGRHFKAVAPHFPDTLESLLALAVLGNAVDFFRPHQEVAREFSRRVGFALSHLEAFRSLLDAGPGLLLLLADNAGEEHFDAPLVQLLRRRGWEATYVVKGGPIQNDLTRGDLAASGLSAALEPVLDTGARSVGLVYAETSLAFQEAYRRAGLIITKGMGHFETLGHTRDPRLFFLLQAKCGPVARALGVRQGDFVFAHARQIHF